MLESLISRNIMLVFYSLLKIDQNDALIENIKLVNKKSVRKPLREKMYRFADLAIL